METLNRTIVTSNSYTERILQFGEGNFLRAFADWMIHIMNKKIGFDAGVVVVQPINEGLVEVLNDQNGLYTLYLNGIKNGEVISKHEVIDCIQRAINPYLCYEEYLALAENPDLRFVISNTTEAGIAYNKDDKISDAPQKSFPGKLTALLYKRFHFFKGASDKGLIILPCELIDRNGDNLKKIVLKYIEDWQLEDEFVTWIEKNIVFCNTLVDRIVPGYPKDKINEITLELGYKDNLLVEGELFHLWVIEGPAFIKNELPLNSCGLNVIFTDDMEPYRTRKVSILNGAHTALVPVGYLCGIDTVRESLHDDEVGKFLKDTIYDNICPTLNLPKEELIKFSEDVLERFRNPFLEHKLMSISLNSISKFKTRLLPSILEFIKRKNKLPFNLLFSLAALIIFYRGDRDGTPIEIKDNKDVLEFFKKVWSTDDVVLIAEQVLSNTNFWEIDLTKIDGFQDAIVAYIKETLTYGMKTALTTFNQSGKE